MVDYLRIAENTRCLLAGFQRPRLRRCMYLMMEVFKFSRKKELREALLNVHIPDILEDTLNEYIIDTEPDDYSVQRFLPFASPCAPSCSVMQDNEILALSFHRKAV